MKRATCFFIVCIALWLPCVGRSDAVTNDFSQSLVRITVTAQDFDPYIPWQKRPPYTRNGYGIAVSPRRILTSEDLVRNAALIEMQRPQSGERLAAQVVEADEQIGLALLAADPADAPFVPVAIRPDRRLDETTPLQVLQLDGTLAIQTGSAQVLNVEMTELPSAPYPILLYTLVTDIAVNDSTALVMTEGRLAGIVVRYNGNRRTADVLPGSVIAQFLADAIAPPYAGFPMAGFHWSELIDPAKRAYLKADATADGILIQSCLPGSGASEVLQPNDVILEWDGYRIDNLGYYTDPDLGRIRLPHLIKFRRTPGESVPLRVMREGREIELSLRLTRQRDEDALIPENVLKQQTPYLVEGGLIILELTGYYLRARGSNWTQSVDPRLAHLYLTRGDAPEQPGDRVLILAGVLPDRINQDYGMFRQEIITTVNGQSVRNIRDLYRVIGPQGHVERLGLKGVAVELVLDAAALPEANRRIAGLYRIPQLKHPPVNRLETNTK